MGERGRDRGDRPRRIYRSFVSPGDYIARVDCALRPPELDGWKVGPRPTEGIVWGSDGPERPHRARSSIPRARLTGVRPRPDPEV